MTKRRKVIINHVKAAQNLSKIQKKLIVTILTLRKFKITKGLESK